MGMVVGIEIGAQVVRGVVLDPQLRRLAHTAEVALSEPGTERAGLRAALAELRSRLRPGGAPVAVTADLGTIVSRVALPFDDPRRLAEVAAFQVEERLPFEVTGWATDHAVAQRDDAGTELIVFGARRRDVEELLEAMLDAGLYAQLVAPRAASLFGLAGREGAQAVVWVDGADASIVVAVDGRMAFARELPLAREEGTAEAIVREVRITLLTAGVAESECAIYVGGSEPLAERVLHVLGSAPGWRARSLGALVPASGSGEGEAAWAPAAGAALSLVGPQRVDLARALRGPALLLRGQARLVTAFLIVAILSGGAFLAAQVRGALAAQGAAQGGREALRQVWQSVYPGEAMPTEPRLRLLSDLEAARSGARDGPAAVDALPLLRRAVEALPQGAGLQVNGFQVAEGVLVLRCSADSLTAADRAVSALQGVLSASVSAQNPQSLESGGHAFDIVVRWKPQAQEDADG